MEKLILEYTGMRSFSDNKVYKDKEGIYFAKDDYNDIIYIGKYPDNDPRGSIKNIAKYKDLEVVTVGDENLPTEAERRDYMMLGRLKADCDYYLGYGGRYAVHLWAGSEVKQIEEMKKIYNSFSDDKKPEWLTWVDILEYEKQICINI